QRLAAYQLAVLRQLGQQRLELGVEGIALLLGERLVFGDEVTRGVTPRLRGGVDEDDVLHDVLLIGVRRAGRAPLTSDVGTGDPFSTSCSTCLPRLAPFVEMMSGTQR